MGFFEEHECPVRWTFVVVVIATCWVLSFLSVLSFLILPFLGFALFRTSRHRAWIPMVVLLLGNPLGFWFVEGLVDYAKGAPTLRYMGLPAIEFYNIDPKTRCFRRTGGCVVDGDEWVSQGSHNLGVLALATVFGTPSRSYDGPYPTREEALAMVAGSPKLNMSEFVKGRIMVGDRSLELEPGMLEKILSSVGDFSLTAYQYPDAAPGSFAQAADIEGRCLIIRIVEPDPFSTATESENQDHMVLFDRKNLRPFAYYRIKGRQAMRFPRVRYLPEHSR